LKLQSQPRIVPVSQPTHIIVPPQLAPTIKATGLGLSRDRFGINLEQGNLQIHGGNSSAGSSQGIALGENTNKNADGKPGISGQIVHLPPGMMPKQTSDDSPSADPKRIVTLPAQGTNTTAASNSGIAGKIVTLPADKSGNVGVTRDPKAIGQNNHAVDLRTDPRPQFQTGRTSGNTAASSGLRIATTNQTHGPVLQSNGQGSGRGGFWH
jgi:hypothetical protein